MTDYRSDSDDLKSRLLYPDIAEAPVPELAGDGGPEVVLVETTLDEEHHLKDDVADAADAVADKAGDAASTVSGAAGDVAHAVGEAAGDAAHAVSDATTHAASAVKEAAPSRAQIKRGANRVAELAQESPFGLVITGACVGFLTGMLLPTTTVDEKMGPYAEQVVDRAREAGHSAVEQGKHAMQEAAPAVGAALRS